MAKSPGERLAMACCMFETFKALILAEIRATNRNLTERDVRKQLFLRLYGQDFGPEQRERILAHFDRV